MSHRSLTARIPVRWLLLAALLAAAWIVVGATAAQADEHPGGVQNGPQSKEAGEQHALLPGVDKRADRLRSNVGKTIDAKVAKPLKSTTRGVVDRALPSSEAHEAAPPEVPAAPSPDAASTSDRDAAGTAPQGAPEEPATAPKRAEKQDDSSDGAPAVASRETPQPAPSRSVETDVKRKVEQVLTPEVPAPTREPSAEPVPQSAPEPVNEVSNPPAPSTEAARSAKPMKTANPVAKRDNSPRPLTHAVSAVDQVLGDATHDVRQVTRRLPTAKVTESQLGSGLQDAVLETVSRTTTATKQVAMAVDDQVATTSTQVDEALHQGPVVRALLGDRPVSTILGGVDHTVTAALDPVTEVTASTLGRTSTVVTRTTRATPAIPAVLPGTVPERDGALDAPDRSSVQAPGQRPRVSAVQTGDQVAQPSVAGTAMTAASHTGELVPTNSPAAVAAPHSTRTAPVAAQSSASVEQSLVGASVTGQRVPTSPQPLAPSSPVAGVGGSSVEAGSGGAAAPVSLPPSTSAKGGLVELFSVRVQDWALPNAPSHDPGSSPD